MNIDTSKLILTILLPTKDRHGSMTHDKAKEEHIKAGYAQLADDRGDIIRRVTMMKLWTSDTKTLYLKRGASNYGSRGVKL